MPQSTVLPPGVSAADFKSALRAFAQVVGEQWVLSSDEDRHSYLDAFAPGDADQHASSAGIAPQSTQEVQAVVKIAARYGIPLWPVSSGRNLAYGGSAPVLRGSVVLDLRRMNRVLEIDEQLGYALVEPGVTFFALYDALQAAGGKLWISTPAPGWGSVIGNALEHGVGYTPYGVHADTICGMEVVLANGEVVRTGMGAVQGSKEWQAFKYGYGPVWDLMFTQSNFGVVTKMGVWLMPQPEAVANYAISVPDYRDLAILVDTLRPLRLNDTINADYTIQNPFRSVMDELSMQGKTRETIYSGAGSLPMELITRELKARNRGMWNVGFNLFDSDKGLDLREAAIREAFARVPGSKLQTHRWHRGEPMESWMRVTPALAPLAGVDWYGGPGGHINFAPVIAPIGERVTQLYEAIYKRFMEYGIDYYCGLLNIGQRALVVNAVTFFNRDNAEMTRKGRELYRVLAKDGAAMGYGDYRAHISFMDDIAAMYGFNDHALRRLNERIKDALDPKGILAPGKQGIWPAGLRGAAAAKRGSQT
jgi:4-cresol dehydrogenase (hydroxylating) flavoprotein subunit